MKKTAIVITPICPLSHGVYGVRLELRGNTWFRTWAFPMKPDTADREGFKSKTDLSNMGTDSTFQGCPYCKSKALIHCDGCGKIYCYKGEKKTTCPSCGSTGEVYQGGWNAIQGGGY